eukprot:672833-Amphidinium_carterae.1
MDVRTVLRLVQTNRVAYADGTCCLWLLYVGKLYSQQSESSIGHAARELVKDHRCGITTTEASGVLDGESLRWDAQTRNELQR